MMRAADGDLVGPGALHGSSWKMDFLNEFLGFLRERRKFWLVPGLLMMVILGALAVFTKGSIVAPFIYTIF